MKIAICSQGPGADSLVDQRFGRCAYFIIADSDGEHYEAVPNPGVEAAVGAGIQTAQFLEERDVSAVLVGNIGPKAFAALNAGRIKVYTGISGTIADALAQYREGKLSLVSHSTVASHFGLGRGQRKSF